MRLASIPFYATRPIFLIRRIAYKLYEITHADEPWMAQGAVRFCEAHLDKTMVGLEWGSGRSTAWFASKLKFLTSIEHDGVWHRIVKQRLSEKKCVNVDYRHVALDHDVKEPTHAVYEKVPAYVEAISAFSDESLDLVIIDGHYRLACVIAALPKIKRGAYLLIDNTNWMPLEQWGVPKEWPVAHQSTNVMTETTIWKKP